MLQAGTLLQERFLIEQELARGGMGAVYVATDQKFGSRVAIKERFYEHAELADAFEREARILNSVHHPILPHVSDYFSDNEGHFLVMEYIEGEDLSEILKRDGAFPVADVVRWGQEILDGLDYLHSQDPPIIHRDIKPGNLKLTSRGNIVLLDFGLAKETGGGAQGVKSVFGYSRRYSPLEQIEGAGTDARSDIFSLGATLFHLITGEPPVDVLSRASAIVSGRPDTLKPANEVNPAVSPEIADILKSALALDANRRFVSAAAMKAALGDAFIVSASVETAAPVIADQNVIDTQRRQPVEHTREGGPGDTLPLEDDPGGRAVVLPASEGRIYKKATRSLNGIPIWHRPAIWAAVVLFALMLLGYTAFRPGFSNDTVTPLAEQQIQKTPVATIEASAEETAKPETEEPFSPPTVPVNDVTRADVKAQPRRDEARDTKPYREPAKTQRSSSQQRRIRAQQTRRPIQRQEAYQAPASSIEMIFTGVQPQRRRRVRPLPY